MDGKLASLRARLREMGRVAVAYSGGVDSTVLLAIAAECAETVAIICDSVILSPRQREEALRTASSLGLPVRVVRCDHLSSPRFIANLGDRCYHCKRLMYSEMRRVADEERFPHLVDGELADDIDRPGHRAAAELGVSSPLAEAGMGKEDVLRLASEMGLPVPPKDTCAATRIPRGERLSRSRLLLVIEAERAVRAAGAELVRVRLEGRDARIEVMPRDMPLVLEDREGILERLEGLGLGHVSLDLRGYRYGSHGGAGEAEPGDER